MTPDNRMIHKKKNGIKETFSTKFKRGSLLWGVVLLVIFCVLGSGLSAWSLEKLQMVGTGAIRFYQQKTG